MEKKRINQSEMKEIIASYLAEMTDLAKENYYEMHWADYYAARREIARVLYQVVSEQDIHCETQEEWQSVFTDICQKSKDTELVFWKRFNGFYVPYTIEDILQVQ